MIFLIIFFDFYLFSTFRGDTMAYWHPVNTSLLAVTELDSVAASSDVFRVCRKQARKLQGHFEKSKCWRVLRRLYRINVNQRVSPRDTRALTAVSKGRSALTAGVEYRATQFQW